MSDIKHICMHYIGNGCKYGNSCTKIHATPTPELHREVEKKGTAVCSYYPNCIFTSSECKRLHVIPRNGGDINDLRQYYLKLLELDLELKEDKEQVDKVKLLIKQDLDLIKETYNVIINKLH